MPDHRVEIMLCCEDKRLPEHIVNYMKEKGILGNCYLVTRAGGVKDFASPISLAFPESLWKDVGIAVEKGGATRIIMCNHSDCTAYGGKGAFDSPQGEREFHLGEMRKAKEIISAKYPSLEVGLEYAGGLPDKKVEFEEIKN
jgi:carbonic anhydrase